MEMEKLKFKIEIECTANPYFREMNGCKVCPSLNQCVPCSFGLYDERDTIARE